MNINDIKQFKAGFEDGYGKPLPRGWIFIVIVKFIFFGGMLCQFVAEFR